MSVAARRVLVVEDDASVREAICDYLTELGYAVEPAANGAEAIARVEQGGLELVVTDYRMPDMTGLDFARQLRARRSTLPVVIVSGWVSVFEEDARALGLSVLAKPIEFKVFAQTLEAAMSGAAKRPGPSEPAR